MLTPVEIKTIIDANFNDIRLFSIQSFISKLISRKTFNNYINQYRILNTVNNTYITTLAEFTFNIDPITLSAEYSYYSDKTTGDKIRPSVIIIGNYIVELNRMSDEDAGYFSMFGDSKKIMFMMNYLSDSDAVLPLKLFDVKLI